MKLIINTDGGSRGNPGPAGIGLVIRRESGEVIFQHGEAIGQNTNNYAEYTALVKAMEAARDLGGKELDVLMDSELIVKQMNGQYKIKDSTLKVLAEQVLRLKNYFEKVTFKHIPREQNAEADKLVNLALDGKL